MVLEEQYKINYMSLFVKMGRCTAGRINRSVGSAVRWGDLCLVIRQKAVLFENKL